MSNYAGMKIKTNVGPMEIKSVKYTGLGCGENMEVIKKVTIKTTGGLKIKTTESELRNNLGLGSDK